MPHNTNQAEQEPADLTEKIDQQLWKLQEATLMGGYDSNHRHQQINRNTIKHAIIQLIAAEIKAAELRVIETVATDQGWQQSRDHLARKFGFPDKHSHAPGDCMCAATLTGEQQ